MSEGLSQKTRNSFKETLVIGYTKYTIYCNDGFLPNILILDSNVSRETFSRFSGGMFHVKQLVVVFEKGFTSDNFNTTIYSYRDYLIIREDTLLRKHKLFLLIGRCTKQF